MKQLLDLMGPTGNVIAGAFKQMEIAEEEIEAAQKRWPLFSTQIWEAFRLLQGTPPVEQEKLYRAHCQELLDRIPEGKPMQTPTKAEVLGVLCSNSQRAPLHQTATFTYIRIFKEVFGTPDFLEDSPEYELYPGSSKECQAGIMRKMAHMTDFRKTKQRG